MTEPKVLSDILGRRVVEIEIYCQDGVILQDLEQGQFVGAKEIEVTVMTGDILRVYVNHDGQLVVEVD